MERYVFQLYNMSNLRVYTKYGFDTATKMHSLENWLMWVKRLNVFHDKIIKHSVATVKKKDCTSS